MSSTTSSSYNRLLTFLPNALYKTLRRTVSTAIYAVQYTQRHYTGSALSINRDFAILRAGRRDRYVLVDTSLEFPVYHRMKDGLPVGFKVYRVKKGWLAGFFGWGWSGANFGRTGWEDVTPAVEMKATKTSSNLTYSSSNGDIKPSKSFLRDVASYWSDKAITGEDENGVSAAPSPKADVFDAVTHISVHVPLTTADGFYRYIITDVNDKIVATTPDYTLHSSFTSFGILKGSSIQALPIQVVGFVIKNAIAGVVSSLLTAVYFTGITPHIAIRIFMWYFSKEVRDAKERAIKYVQQSGAVKPLDYLARAAGGALPGSHARFLEYEKEWDGRKGSFVAKGIDRSAFVS